MRYSFHGKVRATGQQVDGYVEAETSSEAIDRLADQGIIGVYSVRAEPRQPRNSVLLAGTPEFDRALYEQPDPPRQKRRALPAPIQPPQQVLVPVPVAAPQPVQPPPPLPVAEGPVASVSDTVMTQLVDKLSVLIGQMQEFLKRPAQVVYASGGPAREGSRGGGGKRASRNVSDAQNSTLRDIFQNNLDLRRSLQKLADTVAPPPAANGTPVAVTAVPVGPESEPELNAESQTDTEPPPPAVVATADVGHATSADLDLPATADLPVDGSGHDLSMLVHDEDHARHAQPAA